MDITTLTDFQLIIFAAITIATAFALHTSWKLIRTYNRYTANKKREAVKTFENNLKVYRVRKLAGIATIEELAFLNDNEGYSFAKKETTKKKFKWKNFSFKAWFVTKKTAIVDKIRMYHPLYGVHQHLKLLDHQIEDLQKDYKNVRSSVWNVESNVRNLRKDVEPLIPKKPKVEKKQVKTNIASPSDPKTGSCFE